MGKFWKYLRKKKFRLIDSHIGIAGAHLFIKVLAVYGGTTLYLISIGTMKLFSFSLEHHYHYPSSSYPPYTFLFSILGFKIIDTGKEAKRLTSEWSKKYMKECADAEEAEKERVAELEQTVEALREML